jgi:hypothetical protein
MVKMTLFYGHTHRMYGKKITVTDTAGLNNSIDLRWGFNGISQYFKIRVQYYTQIKAD